MVRLQAMNGLDVIDFLTHLLQVAGGGLWVVWDRSPIHRRAEVQQFVARIGPDRLRLFMLPPYAPDLNPAEPLWQHLKHVELRNRICPNLETLHLELQLAVNRLRKRPRLIRAFFNAAGLAL